MLDKAINKLLEENQAHVQSLMKYSSWVEFFEGDNEHQVLYHRGKIRGYLEFLEAIGTITADETSALFHYYAIDRPNEEDE